MINWRDISTGEQLEQFTVAYEDLDEKDQATINDEMLDYLEVFRKSDEVILANEGRATLNRVQAREGTDQPSRRVARRHRERYVHKTRAIKPRQVE